MPGDVAGNYNEKWTKTFDLQFLILWLVLFLVLLVCTLVSEPSLFEETAFFQKMGIKLLVMMVLSLLGGLVCRHYCNTDEKGYITSSKSKWFKVNYTRKIQHFAAYLVPLVSPPTEPLGILPHLCGVLKKRIFEALNLPTVSVGDEKFHQAKLGMSRS